jgi:hypothetical protein
VRRNDVARVGAFAVSFAFLSLSAQAAVLSLGLQVSWRLWAFAGVIIILNAVADVVEKGVLMWLTAKLVAR